jgi:hypothetical protein
MKAMTKVKTSSITHNHNETLVRDAAQAGGLKVKTGLKAGHTSSDGTSPDARAHARGLKVKTGVKAGITGTITYF